MKFDYFDIRRKGKLSNTILPTKIIKVKLGFFFS